jgi:HSP20 family protein
MRISHKRSKNSKVSVDNGVLSIAGERKQEKEEKGKRFHRVERYHGSFRRSFTLPENVNTNKIKAVFSNGMLNLELPKTEEAKPKAIEVKVE